MLKQHVPMSRVCYETAVSLVAKVTSGCLPVRLCMKNATIFSFCQIMKILQL